MSCSSDRSVPAPSENKGVRLHLFSVSVLLRIKGEDITSGPAWPDTTHLRSLFSLLPKLCSHIQWTDTVWRTVLESPEFGRSCRQWVDRGQSVEQLNHFLLSLRQVCVRIRILMCSLKKRNICMQSGLEGGATEVRLRSRRRRRWQL